jgi:hypothetical protein
MAYSTLDGIPVIPAADLVDEATDCNLTYPNGIGKRRGMFVFNDTGSELELFMANGAGVNDLWMGVGTQASADITPAA